MQEARVHLALMTSGEGPCKAHPAYLSPPHTPLIPPSPLPRHPRQPLTCWREVALCRKRVCSSFSTTSGEGLAAQVTPSGSVVPTQ